MCNSSRRPPPLLCSLITTRPLLLSLSSSFILSITVIVQVFIIFLAPPLKFKHHENKDVFLVHGYIHNAWHLNMSESVKVNMGSEGGEVAREKAGALRGFQSAHESLPLSPSWTTVILRMQSTASRSSRGQSHFTVAHRRARQMSFSK